MINLFNYISNTKNFILVNDTVIVNRTWLKYLINVKGIRLPQLYILIHNLSNATHLQFQGVVSYYTFHWDDNYKGYITNN